MTYSTHGIPLKLKLEKPMAIQTLTKLQRFRNLSEKQNKRKLHLTIVRPQLLYPIIPLNSISKTAKTTKQSNEIY